MKGMKLIRIPKGRMGRIAAWGWLLMTPFLAIHGMGNLDPKNLVAWCIVPFDASQRSPSERAQMLKELGLRRCAYDWRNEHVGTFEEEILEYKKHGIEFFAFWSEHEHAFGLFEKHGLTPQIWKTAPSPKGNQRAERIKASADALEPLVKKVHAMGCRFGLYNHGGWGGEPRNLIAVCRALRERGYDNAGIVYNWHHGHDEIDSWEEDLRSLRPYLWCLNLNGMNADAKPKILPIGKGQFDLPMLKVLLESGYDGPIGILDHRNELDAKLSLQANLDGLEKSLKLLR